MFCVITKDEIEAGMQGGTGAYSETHLMIQESNENYSASLDTLTIKGTLNNHHRHSQASSTALIVSKVIGAIK